MADKVHYVEGLPIGLSWQGNLVDPTNWRNMSAPDSELENDEDEPCPEYVKDILGFDPDDEDWEEE